VVALVLEGVALAEGVKVAAEVAEEVPKVATEHCDIFTFLYNCNCNLWKDDRRFFFALQSCLEIGTVSNDNKMMIDASTNSTVSLTSVQ